MRIKECKNCTEEFDLDSPEKQAIGGYANLCCDCSEEDVPRYAGVQSADGKQSQATILKFESDADRVAYLAFWRNNSGIHKNKGCQLGNHLSTTPNIKFETVTAFKPTNHKGKA